MTAPKNPPVYNDHQAIAEHARACPGRWVSAGLYQSGSGAEGTARKVRKGETAYEPAGAYEAMVRRENGIEVLVRYIADTIPTPIPLIDDRRPLARVAEPRMKRSADPTKFRTAMARTLTAVVGGEDLAGARWTADDPIQLAAEIEVLAGVRRLNAFRKDSK